MQKTIQQKSWYSYYTMIITLRPHYKYDLRNLGRQLHCSRTIDIAKESGGRKIEIRRAFKYGGREELNNLGFFIRRVIGDFNLLEIEGYMLSDGERDKDGDIISLKKGDYELHWNFNGDLSVPSDHGGHLEWESGSRYHPYSLAYGPIERDESNPELNEPIIEYTEREPIPEFTLPQIKTCDCTTSTDTECDTEPAPKPKQVRRKVRSLATGPTQAIRVDTTKLKESVYKLSNMLTHGLLIACIVLELVAIHMIKTS